MIHNPMVVQVSGGEPQWQELKLDGTQDVPMTRVPDPMVTYTFELRFEKLPSGILFRSHYGGADYYSALFRPFSNTNPTTYWIIRRDNSGCQSATVNGTTIEGTLGADSKIAEFLPIYTDLPL